MKALIRTRQNGLIAISAVILVLQLSPSASAISLPKTARLAPPETVLLIDIPNFSATKTQLEKTSFYKLYKDPAMAPFIENVKAKWKESVKELDDNNLYRALAEGEVLPQGRLAVIMILNEQTKDANELPAILIAQWGENISKIKEMIARMVEKNIEMGGRSQQVENFQGIKIESLVDEGDVEVSYCFIDDCLIASFYKEGLKFTLAHLKGAAGTTLADDPDYTNTINAIGPQAEINIYVNIKHLVQMAVAEDSEKTIITNLGFDNVTGFGAAVTVGREPKKPLTAKGLLKINGSKKGICRMLEPRSKPFNVPRFIPAEACRVSTINIDIKQAYSELVTAVTAISPMAAAIFYNPLSPPSEQGEPGMKLKEDIIDYFGDEVVIAQSMIKPFSQTKFPAEYIIAISTNNRQALEKSMAVLHTNKIAVNDPDATREFLGETIYLIRPDKIPFLNQGGMQPLLDVEEKDQMPIPTMAFTVTDTHFICGLESSVEKAIRTNKEGGAITSTRWFNHARSVLPDNVGMVSMEDNRATTEFLWWLLKETQKDPGQAAQAAPTASYMIHDFEFDWSLLPDYEKVKKYLGLSISYLISRDDGFFIEFKAIDQQ